MTVTGPNTKVVRMYSVVLEKESYEVLKVAIKCMKKLAGGDMSPLSEVYSAKKGDSSNRARIIRSALNDLPYLAFGDLKRCSGPLADKCNTGLDALARSLSGRRVRPDSSGRISLELSGRLVRVASVASEIYARLLARQLSIVFEYLPAVSPQEWQHDLECVFKKLKGLENSKDRDTKKNIAWDILLVLRHRLAWDANPGGGNTVDFGTPLSMSGVPSPTIIEIQP